MRTDLIYINTIYLDYNQNFDMKFAQNSTSLYGIHVDKAHFSMPRSAASYINKAVSFSCFLQLRPAVLPAILQDSSFFRYLK